MDELVLVTYGSDFVEIGRMAAGLDKQINEGVEPLSLPIETAEVFSTINLKTAEKIGLEIPDSLLMQAKKIIRSEPKNADVFYFYDKHRL